jgi:hypothetical protein
MLSKGDKWTAEEDAKLRQLAELGVPRRNIALKLRRTESGVKNRARDLNVTLPRNRHSAFRTRHAVALACPHPLSSELKRKPRVVTKRQRSVF